MAVRRRLEKQNSSLKTRKDGTNTQGNAAQSSAMTFILCSVSACVIIIIVALYVANKEDFEFKQSKNTLRTAGKTSQSLFDDDELKTSGKGNINVKEELGVPESKEELEAGSKGDVPASLEQQEENREDKKEDPYEPFRVLPRLDGVKVGHIQTLELSPGKTYNIITRSLRPLVFEIPEFLTDEECQMIIDQSIHQGMEASDVKDGTNELTIEDTSKETYMEWDYNGDGVISTTEVMHNLIDLSDLYFSEDDIIMMFQELDIDKNNDGLMDFEEFLHVTTDRIMRYLHEIAKGLPRVKSRHSRQTWIDHKQIPGLNQRVAALIQLPVSVIEGSERMQVVSYGPDGHYHCHHDSQEIDDHVPCCDEHDERQCRLCRFITVLYFLNEVEEGGETAFPVADNVTFSMEAWREITKYRCDLSRHCYKANLYIKPKKRSAIMWYNHHKNETTGWIGALDEMSYHGGCDVIKGRKWIANNWINIMGSSRDRLAFHRKTEDAG